MSPAETTPTTLRDREADAIERALRRNTLRDRIQEAVLDLDSREAMAMAAGYDNMEWRRWSALDIAEDIARQVAPTLDAAREQAATEAHRELLAARILLERWTTGDVTGFCAACREMTVRNGGKTPNVLDGEPHRRDCPIGEFRLRTRRLIEETR